MQVLSRLNRIRGKMKLKY